ncbi:hypothetical protein PR202_ga15657 [Eleusine coracana subsp. coracana]|uniref:Uncharacterized protein n=1 Tax=Eleusine coracana subsp. coracana TaxID=191504 RepID=A0AAV5CKS7_ELECO|nr:hypothetical protein PR202_ga15657 [Eleusine coracana subsp. coracana]
MASRLPGAAGFEEACREIHDACSQPRFLGLLLALRSPSERQQIRATYRATFGEDLAGTLQRIVVANQENELCKLLYLWTLEPADRDAIIAQEAVDGGMTVAGYQTLVEVFTRRKQNQLFFTKQAYMARFRRNLEQDMVTEPAHPYQRARNVLCFSLFLSSAVLLTRLSCNTVSVQALKTNGSGEFEESLRVVVKCIHTPSKYYSKLLQRSMQCTAPDKRLVARAIFGSDDVGIDEIKSVFKSSYGRNLADFIHETLPESDYRDFLVAVATASATS